VKTQYHLDAASFTKGYIQPIINLNVMYKNVLQSIENIAIWPIISFVIFFVFFLCLLLWVFTTDKKFIDKMKSMPMDDSTLKEENFNIKL
jgi:cytochrome c oxidase cbb3-type subunit 4